MKKTYWVMKAPGSTAEWVEMTGKQFYAFITSPDGRGRCFMDCGTYEIEVSPEQYKQWKRESNHSDYLRGFEGEVLILSLESLAADSGITAGEMVADQSVNVENTAITNINSQRLHEALLSLPYDEQWLINELYLRGKTKNEREIGELIGVSKQWVNKRKTKTLKKLEKLLVVKPQKSQQ